MHTQVPARRKRPVIAKTQQRPTHATRWAFQRSKVDWVNDRFITESTPKVQLWVRVMDLFDQGCADYQATDAER